MGPEAVLGANAGTTSSTPPQTLWATPVYAVRCLWIKPKLCRRKRLQEYALAVADRACTNALAELGRRLVEGDGAADPTLSLAALSAADDRETQVDRETLWDSAFEKEQAERLREHTVLSAGLGPLRDRETRLVTRLSVFEQDLVRIKAKVTRAQIELRNAADQPNSPRVASLQAELAKSKEEVNLAQGPVDETLGKLTRARTKTAEALARIGQLEVEGRTASASLELEIEDRPQRMLDLSAREDQSLRLLSEAYLDKGEAEMNDPSQQVAKTSLELVRQKRRELAATAAELESISGEAITKGLLLLGSGVVLLAALMALLVAL